MHTATPLPWTLSENRIAPWKTFIEGANGRPVADTVYPLAKPDWHTEDEANAAFIVQACNSYDAMKEAIEKAIEHSEWRTKVQGGRDTFAKKIQPILEAALAKASKKD